MYKQLSSYKLYSRLYKIYEVDTNPNENYINLVKYSNQGKYSDIYYSHPYYISIFTTNDLSKLLKQYINGNKIEFKNKNELDNFLFNFSNYYNLKLNTELEESIWIYNKKIFVSRRYGVWTAGLNFFYLKNKAKEKDLDILEELGFSELLGKGNNRQEAIIRLCNIFPIKVNNYNLNIDENYLEDIKNSFF